jgi:PTS system nitrogen regulatory IIA component
MNLTDIIHPDEVILDLRAGDKEHLLAELARQVGARVAVNPRDIQTALGQRERLGSTGLGRGFALPHARLEGFPQIFGLFARLARPIDFEAIDGRPVDLVFLLLIPEDAGNSHVSALAAVSRRLRDETILQQLRKADTVLDLYKCLVDAP